MHSILSTRGLRGHLSDAIPLTGSLLIGCTTAPRASGPPVRPLDPGITSFTRVNPFVFSDLLYGLYHRLHREASLPGSLAGHFHGLGTPTTPRPGLGSGGLGPGPYQSLSTLQSPSLSITPSPRIRLPRPLLKPAFSFFFLLFQPTTFDKHSLFQNSSLIPPSLFL